MSDFDASNISVEQWPIEKLIPYEKNHKKHPDAHVKALAASITEFGVEHPIAVEEDGTIISGHGRRLALLSLERKFAPVRVFRGITKEQAAKLRIAANKTTSTDYDTDVLAAELRKLTEDGVSLDGIGLSDKEMTTLMKDIGEIDLGAMSEDITADVAVHEESVQQDATKADGEAVRLDKAFGFKTVNADEARILTRFLGVLEAEHGTKDSREAFMLHMSQVVDGA
jgi:ParB-like chromosome segregation protein Spo0J